VNLVDTYTYGQFRGTASERKSRAKKKETQLINRMLMEEDEDAAVCLMLYIPPIYKPYIMN